VYFGGTKRFAAGDYVRRWGVRPRLFSVAAEVALLSDRSISRVLLDAIRDGLKGGAWNIVDEVGFNKLASKTAVSAVSRKGGYPHPWFRSVPDAVGSAVATMLALSLSRPFYDALTPYNAQYPEFVSPLMSQPIVEVCMRIPSYVHISGGIDRSIARQAFVAEAPKENISRQWKDRAAGYSNASLMQNTEFAKELLLDGALAQHGLLDRNAVLEGLTVAPTKLGAYPLEVYSQLATEIWVRNWTEPQRRAAA
jgi:asparagine synthase (glutamine-hydrolysing)